jgi:hypothetical protein
MGKRVQTKETAKAVPAPVVEATKQMVMAAETTPAVAGSAGDMAAWGAAQITSQDIVIPRILLMQPMSDAVTAGTAAFGEFRESLNHDCLGKFEEGFEVVPFHMEKVFIEYDASNVKKKEFLRVVAITPDNENLPYEDNGLNKEGKKIPISRDRCMNFYVLLPKELEMGGAIPYIVSARRTSLNAGKKLATQMYVKNMSANRTPAHTICKVFANKKTNDEGTFGVMDVMPVKATPDAWIVEAFKWLQVVKAGKAKVDEKSYNEEAKATESRTVTDVESGPQKF